MTAPAYGVIRAASRWLVLLQRSTVTQASALIQADSAYTDLTLTQYAAALDWLASVGLLEPSKNGHVLGDRTRGLSEEEINIVVFERSLEALAPPWLPDADTLVADVDDLPEDATALAGMLYVTDASALLTIRRVAGKIDLAARAKIGASGEAGVVALLEEQWPGSTRHVALIDDGLGYDVAFSWAGLSWHLEIKATTRRGQLVLYLSRHEHEVALSDPQWRLVVVGLNDDGEAEAVATARHDALQLRAPRDRSPAARWEVTRHRLGPRDLECGMPFVRAPLIDVRSILVRGWDSAARPYAWMPAYRPSTSLTS